MRRLLLALAFLLPGCADDAPPPPPTVDSPPVPSALQGCFRVQVGARSTIPSDDLRNPASRWCYLDLDRPNAERLLASAWRPGLELAVDPPSLEHSGRVQLLIRRPEQVLYREPDRSKRSFEEQEVRVPAETWELTGQVGQRLGEDGETEPTIEGVARVVSSAGEGQPALEYAFRFLAVRAPAMEDDASRGEAEDEQLRLLREPLPPQDLTTRAHSW